jgi:hypothetical protein
MPKDSKVDTNYGTPLSELPSKIGSASSFDNYVLIGKQGSNITVYSNSNDDTQVTNLLDQFTDSLQTA